MDEKRLYWGSRRGMLELDLILMPFLENIYPGLERADQQRYEQLLACEDQDLYAWLMGRETPEDAEIQRIVSLILANTGLQPQ